MPEAEQRVRDALQAEGFRRSHRDRCQGHHEAEDRQGDGRLSHPQVPAIRRWPEEAMKLEPRIGAMLPCNVILRSVDGATGGKRRRSRRRRCRRWTTPELTRIRRRGARHAGARRRRGLEENGEVLEGGSHHGFAAVLATGRGSSARRPDIEISFTQPLSGSTFFGRQGPRGVDASRSRPGGGSPTPASFRKGFGQAFRAGEPVGKHGGCVIARQKEEGRALLGQTGRQWESCPPCRD